MLLLEKLIRWITSKSGGNLLARRQCISGQLICKGLVRRFRPETKIRYKGWMGANGSSFQHGDCHSICAKAFLNKREGKQSISFCQAQHRFRSDNVIVIVGGMEKSSPDGGTVGFFLREEEGCPIAIRSIVITGKFNEQLEVLFSPLAARKRHFFSDDRFQEVRRRFVAISHEWMVSLMGTSRNSALLTVQRS